MQKLSFYIPPSSKYNDFYDPINSPKVCKKDPYENWATALCHASSADIFR